MPTTRQHDLALKTRATDAVVLSHLLVEATRSLLSRGVLVYQPLWRAAGLSFFALSLLRFALAGLVLPVPTALMGAPRRSTGTLPVLGAREIASGVGILASGRPTGWLWSRVLGDAVDLAVLGRSLRGSRRRPQRLRLLASIGAVVAVAALDVLTAWVFTQRRRRARFFDRIA